MCRADAPNNLGASPLHSEVSLQLHQMFCVSKEEDPVQKLWSLEAIGIKSEELGPIEVENSITENFRKKVSFDGERYSVGLPWKGEQVEIASNFHVAKGRLGSLVRSLCPSGEPTAKFDKYNANIQDQLVCGIVEKVMCRTENADDSVIHYIPHMGVVREDKETTKLRLVYDASAKTPKNGPSLNDHIHAGPCLLNDLTGMLLRFRLPKIAIVSDIEKAFLQVGLNRKDRDATRFLWLKDTSKLTVENNIQVLRFTRIPFGLVCSPYLLAATINYHLEKNPSSTCELIRNNIYVDNVVVGVDDVREAIKLYQQAKAIFGKASMNLREWISNSNDFNRFVPVADQAQGPVVNVLGLAWCVVDDHFAIKAKVNTLSKFTKRTTLQQLASVFDPLGLLAPILIKGKIIYQDTWKGDHNWDDPLPCDLEDRWKSFEHELKGALCVRFKRMVQPDKSQPIDLLCFVDASQEAYSAAVYLRQEYDSGCSCELIFAKARVAPIKRQLTIPKLELTAALIGARSLRFVARELHKPVRQMYMWSDSQITLHWLHSAKPLPAYIARRKSEIMDSKDIELGYVNTRDNPADLATRGLSASQFSESNWFSGQSGL